MFAAWYICLAVTGLWRCALNKPSIFPRAAYIKAVVIRIPTVAKSLREWPSKNISVRIKSARPRVFCSPENALSLNLGNIFIRFQRYVPHRVIVGAWRYDDFNSFVHGSVIINRHIRRQLATISDLQRTIDREYRSNDFSRIRNAPFKDILRSVKLPLAFIYNQNSLLGIHQSVRTLLGSFYALSSQKGLPNQNSDSNKSPDNANDGESQIPTVKAICTWVVCVSIFCLTCWCFFIAAPYRCADGRYLGGLGFATFGCRCLFLVGWCLGLVLK
jgi:hypothetical protein